MTTLAAGVRVPAMNEHPTPPTSPTPRPSAPAPPVRFPAAPRWRDGAGDTTPRGPAPEAGDVDEDLHADGSRDDDDYQPV